MSPFALAPLLVSINLDPERFARRPITEGDSVHLCLAQSFTSHAASGTEG